MTHFKITNKNLSPMKSVKIGDIEVRIDKESGFLCVTDLASIRGTASDNIRGWMKNTQTLRFFEAWERDNSTDEQGLNFEDIYRQNRDQAFYISGSKLVAIGCQGIFVKKGKWGGTFCGKRICYEDLTRAYSAPGPIKSVCLPSRVSIHPKSTTKPSSTKLPTAPATNPASVAHMGGVRLKTNRWVIPACWQR
jgi:hypothetical protein